MIGSILTVASWLTWGLVLVVCTVLGGLYAGLETGVYVMNKVRLELRAESGSRRARFLRRMIANSNNLLAVLLIGTNVVRYVAAFSITSMFVMAGFGGRSEWYTIAVGTPMMFVISDAIPKGLFTRAAETLTYRLAWLLKGTNWLLNVTGLAPLVRGISALVMSLAGAHRWTQNPLSHHSVAAVLAEGQASGLLTHAQSIMADRVMRIADVTLRKAMKPLRSVVAVPADASHQQVMEVIRAHNYSRLPVIGPSGQFVGVLDTFDVIASDGEVRVSQAASDAFVLPARTTVTDALYRMRRAKQAMAVVADDYDRHVGIVTIKDLVEEIVGELEAW